MIYWGTYLVHIKLSTEDIKLIVQVLEHVDHHHGRRC
jgi:hypothetical protein